MSSCTSSYVYSRFKRNCGTDSTKISNGDATKGTAFTSAPNIHIVTIKVVKPEMITGQNGQKEECVVAHFDGDVKPMILNKTNMKAIEKALKSPYIEDWSGHNIQLYADMVSAFGATTMALRVRDFEPNA